MTGLLQRRRNGAASFDVGRRTIVMLPAPKPFCISVIQRKRVALSSSGLVIKAFTVSFSLAARKARDVATPAIQRLLFAVKLQQVAGLDKQDDQTCLLSKALPA
ncbi:hypothetical protein O9992_02415 [Vibrio lentus]|nr:hypothetical protein [Vibrio lentus]